MCSMKEEEKDPRRWTVLETKYIIRRPWLTARCDKVMHPSGVVNDEYYVLEYPDWVNVIARTKDGDFVMIRQYRHGLGRTCFELVAGVIDPGDESPEAAAKRELWEETGFGGGTWHEISVISANPSTTNNLTHCFVAEGVEKVSTQHLEPTEDITVHLLSKEEVAQLLKNDEIKQALMAAPLWKYFATHGLL